MKQIFALVKNRLGLFIAGCITALTAGLCTAKVIDYINSGLKNQEGITTEFLIGIVGFSLAAASIGVLSSYFVSKINIIIVRELTKKLVRKTLMARYEYIEAVSDKVLPIITKDISDISNFVDRIPTFLIAATAVVGTLVRLFIIDAQLTSYFFIVFGLQTLLVIILIPKLKRYTRISVRFRNFHYRNLGNMVAGLKELSLNKEKRNHYLGEVISSDMNQMNSAFLKGRVTNGVSQRVTDLLIFLFVGIFMYLSIDYLDFDFERFKIFLPIILFVTPYFAKISGFFQDLKSVEVSFEQINSISSEIDQFSISSQKKLQKDASHSDIVALENISYQYLESRHDNSLTFGPLTMGIKTGKITFIIGGNGSGKTTFAKILTGLYEPKTGHIVYKGQKVSEENLIDYRNQFSAYFADSFTFGQLGYIDKNHLDKNAAGTIQLLEMQSKVQLDANYNFSTTNLSFGQISRLSLITKILEDKEIYLFDEWAANQDPYFKKIFYYSILPELKRNGKTVIVISHDEKYFDVADEIIELQEGMTLK
ncbi:cyclic peptide export ABC transporter [Marinoscillum furvescens]|uniref:Putative ATP-binding cassette transporter n=1 Tax=Marinoscillum furvescens DSM 4134 TaxID=1122208 RepID=A0A3D9L3P8_MARFU|nr:cyclic peptide export ABC transporter [Marinoscillum furvescens]RED98001.1 putative ATP-binding cassette transporter [Marinoscillum furvescens DSM 4134]